MSDVSSVMRLKDDSVVTIQNDTDFQYLIRKYLGDDAADWYRGRFSPYDEFYETWKDVIPEAIRSSSDYKVYRDIEETMDTMDDEHKYALIADAFELPGWDQY